MESAITTTEWSGADLVRVELVERARDYAAASKADNTRRAYRSDWAGFSSWCKAQGLECLPATPEAVALYLAARAAAGPARSLGS